MSNQNNIIVNTNYSSIKEFIKYKSDFLYNLISNEPGEYTLINKHLSYADTIAAGKRTDNSQSFDEDYLIYLGSKELEVLNLGVTKQSNITMPPIFYEKLGIEQLKRRAGKQATQHEHVKINDYAKVYLVNDSLQYFTPSYTFKVFEKLSKTVRWNKEDYTIHLAEGNTTEFSLTHAIHGIGTQKDILFHKLRHLIFKNDILHCLIRENSGDKEVYFCFERNPRFFTLVGESNASWEKYISEQNSIHESIIKRSADDLIEDEKTRKMQAKWRNMLADEVMAYTAHDGEVFCAFTMIAANYESLGTLFRASHIKRYENCDTSEAFDINNGLLLCANADALFDKFLITIDEDKKLKFSFLLENNYELKNKLLLNQPIVAVLLNEQRMEYLKWHRAQFEEKEVERKSV